MGIHAVYCSAPASWLENKRKKSLGCFTGKGNIRKHLENCTVPELPPRFVVLGFYEALAVLELSV